MTVMMQLNVPPPQHSEPSSPQYEFSSSQNDAFGDLAMKMRFVGLMGIVVGVVFCLGGAVSLVMGKGSSGALGSLIQGGLSLIVGSWTRSAAADFQRIVDTQGNDLTNLMVAVSELRRIYGLQRLLFVIAIALFSLAIPLALLFM